MTFGRLRIFNECSHARQGWGLSCAGGGSEKLLPNVRNIGAN